MSEFVRYLEEVFRDFGPITARRMFGGHGIYYQGRMFGLVADDVLYLKADAESAPAFIERGMSPFQYVKNNRPMQMSYYTAPEEIYDDPEVASDWARMAWEAACRSAKPDRKK